MTTNATTPDTGIPEGLRRNPDNTIPGATEAKPAAKLTSTPPAQPAAPKAKPAKSAKPKAKPAKQAKPEADDDGPKITHSIVPVRYKARYAATNDTCGSTLSLALKDATTGKNEDGRVALLVPELKSVAEQNGLGDTFRGYVKAGLNNGQLRMNTYNKLVGMLNAGTDVRIGKKVFRAKDWTPPTKPGFKAKVVEPVKAKPAARKPKADQPAANAA